MQFHTKCILRFEFRPLLSLGSSDMAAKSRHLAVPVIREVLLLLLNPLLCSDSLPASEIVDADGMRRENGIMGEFD